MGTISLIDIVKVNYNLLILIFLMKILSIWGLKEKIMYSIINISNVSFSSLTSWYLIKAFDFSY